jgi:hypothetical protein
MTVYGKDCGIVLKAGDREMGLPYTGETIRETARVWEEYAPIEGDGLRRVISQPSGVTGCVTTALTMGTAPLLLALALGRAELPVFVSETRGMFRHGLCLVSAEGGPSFDVIQDRRQGRKVFERCYVAGFELRIHRAETLGLSAVKLRVDIAGDCPAVVYPYQEIVGTNTGERFTENGVTYEIDGAKYRDIYGLTLTTEKKAGTKTIVMLHRVLRSQNSYPSFIEKLTISAHLFRDQYEDRRFGLFRLFLSRLVLLADETAVESGGAVIGPLRYYCAGGVSAEVFTPDDGILL